MNSALSKRRSDAISKYNPERGLQTIAAAEAAEKHFARAKDPSKLEHAIRAKLEAQSEFVLWWDSQTNKAKPGQPKKNSDGSDVILRLGREGLPAEQIVRRWRKKLNASPNTFELTYEAACAKYKKILEFQTTAHVGHNSGEQEWYTPAEYIEAARAVLGEIDLDPATSVRANDVVKASQIFTAAENGLNKQWDGRVWMNPPYAQPLISQFCDKFADSVTAGTVVAGCVLVNNATETQWFRRLADVSSAICFPTGRVRFWNEKKESATPLQGQAVLYAGEKSELFLECFRPFGFLVRAHR